VVLKISVAKMVAKMAHLLPPVRNIADYGGIVAAKNAAIAKKSELVADWLTFQGDYLRRSALTVERHDMIQ
jgi:hypothetical protein